MLAQAAMLVVFVPGEKISWGICFANDGKWTS